MSTKINVIVGDQRLLQENKTRAAANQQALDSRTQQQQLEQQATDAVEEAADEVRSGAPTLVTERRPAAQRRKKKPPAGTQLVGLTNLDLRTVPDSNQLITIPWVAVEPPIMSPPYEITNLIEVETTEYKPYFELLIQDLNEPITTSKLIPGGTPYTIPLNTKQLDWYTAFAIYSFALFFTTDTSVQERVPPKLPFPWEDLRQAGANAVSGAQYKISACASNFVYVSTLFRVFFPADQLTFRANDPTYYTTITGSVDPFPAGVNVSFTRRTVSDFRRPAPVYLDIAVYKKINTTTLQTETRFQSFSIVDTNSSESIPALQFLTYLYDDDPLRAIHLESVNNLSEGQRQRAALERVVFSRYYWPTFINYAKTTGIVVALADTNDPNKKDVMNLQLNTDLAYSVVLQQIGGDFWSDIDNYTRASFERRGFTYVNTVEIAPSLAAVYDAVVPVQAV
jgi:hypothetical protein